MCGGCLLVGDMRPTIRVEGENFGHGFSADSREVEKFNLGCRIIPLRKCDEQGGTRVFHGGGREVYRLTPTNRPAYPYVPG